MGKMAHDKETLRQFHHEAFKQARSTLRQREISAKLKDACMDKIEAVVLKEFEKILERNDEQTASYKDSCELQKSTCLDIAMKQIKERCGEKVLSEEDLFAVHLEVTSGVKETFEKQNRLGPKSVYEKYETELRRELEELLSFAKKMNRDLEKHFLLTATMEVKTAKEEYKVAMSEQTGGVEPLEESDLKEAHSNHSSETETAFMLRLGKAPPDVESECQRMLRNALKHAFNEILRENNQKKVYS